jgi:hypothetical protein
VAVTHCRVAMVGLLAAACVPGARQPVRLDAEVSPVPRVTGAAVVETLEVVLADVWLRGGADDPLPEGLPDPDGAQPPGAAVPRGPLLAGWSGPVRVDLLDGLARQEDVVTGLEGEVETVSFTLDTEVAVSVGLRLPSGEAIGATLPGPLRVVGLPLPFTLVPEDQPPKLRLALVPEVLVDAVVGAPEGGRATALAAALSRADAWTAEVLP